MKMKITRMEHNRFLPEYKTEGSSGMDLYAAIDKEITLKPLERVLVPTGIKIEIPVEYEAQIRARSGLSVKHGITLINAIGTVDADYRGEVGVIMFNSTNEVFEIRESDRIAQFCLKKVLDIQFEEVETVSTLTDRGKKGYGSTGN